MPLASRHSPTPILTLIGPTCVGKTNVGMALAQRLGAEIISADSRQIYRYMNIGTAKPTVAEQQAVRHHMIDIINPGERFSAGEYARQAGTLITGLQQQGTTPLIVGGAGLYVQAMMGGLFHAPDIPSEVRQHLKEQFQEQATDKLYHTLKTVDPEASTRIHPNDRQRIERALEVYEATGIPLTGWHRKNKPTKPDWSLRLIGLKRNREELYKRIDRRVDQMIELGLVEEVHRLLDLGYNEETHALKTFGYAEILDYIKGHLPLQETVYKIRQQTRRYAKRQLTWFRNREKILWVEISADEPASTTCDHLLAQVLPPLPSQRLK
ncbi:MAG: tRNA (adenosine(37)-N6)-dimethylallyltransferase MiaA [Candidatus Latescibacteria bacterium]|nr:tRNA (adenosine(37)-N6)-dimethylallyltransferase MiaA [Candidatus Latescibacterota bacterium]